MFSVKDVTLNVSSFLSFKDFRSLCIAFPSTKLADEKLGDEIVEIGWGCEWCRQVVSQLKSDPRYLDIFSKNLRRNPKVHDFTVRDLIDGICRDLNAIPASLHPGGPCICELD